MTDINTQTKLFYQNKEKARHNEKLKTTTGKVLKGMETMLLREVAALEKFVAEKSDQANAYMEKTWKIAANIEANARERRKLDRDVARLVTKRIGEEKLD